MSTVEDLFWDLQLRTGWDKTSRLAILGDFFDEKHPELLGELKDYLQARAKAEWEGEDEPADGREATCESCGGPAEYTDEEPLLCEDCIQNGEVYFVDDPDGPDRPEDPEDLADIEYGSEEDTAPEHRHLSNFRCTPDEGDAP